MRRLPANKGQALVEMLVLLPVLLMLLVAAADLSKLFAVSGKAEIASRYCALRWFRHAPFEPQGTLYPEPAAEPAVADQLEQIHFAGALDDYDGSQDVSYYRMQRGGQMGGGDFDYSPPTFDIGFWNAMIFLLDQGGNVLPVHANRVGFTYDLPYFPYGKRDPFEDKQTTGRPFWGGDGDPIGGPYPLFTGKGDFVVIAESFYGDGGRDFMNILEQYGLVRSIGPTTIGIGLSLIFVLLLFLGGGG